MPDIIAKGVNGANGNNGTPGQDGQPGQLGAHGVDHWNGDDPPGDGQRGGDGMPGSPGTDGQNGSSGSNVTIQVTDFVVGVNIDTSGGLGGPAGTGKNGGEVGPGCGRIGRTKQKRGE